jgi:hypothetical protein
MLVEVVAAVAALVGAVLSKPIGLQTWRAVQLLHADTASLAFLFVAISLAVSKKVVSIRVWWYVWCLPLRTVWIVWTRDCGPSAQGGALAGVL